MDPRKEQDWKQYAAAMLLFSLVSLAVTYGIQRLQQVLPWNPQGLGPVEPELAFNTAASFTTNTNWQNYGGESTMSYLSQMAGLAWHNFISAAAGIGVALALARGLTRRPGPGGARTLGNFWVDLVRCHRLRPAAGRRSWWGWCWWPRACLRPWAPTARSPPSRG